MSNPQQLADRLKAMETEIAELKKRVEAMEEIIAKATGEGE